DLAAQVTYRLLTDGSYRRHLDVLRPQLARAMAVTIQNLENLGFTLWTRPEAGMFLWAQLPEGIDSSEIAVRALKRQVVLAPGNVFSVSHGASRYLRFNVAQCRDRRTFDVLADVMRS